MKSIKIFSVCLAALLGLSSCASSWLDQELTGSTLTQEEYNSMTNVAEGTVKGIYAYLYSYGGDHHTFGQKSFDIASDLASSDLAMSSQGYGWFEADAMRLTSSRSYDMWTLYYTMIMNANAVLRSLDHKNAMTWEEKGAYAQALTIRAYCYYNIANYFGPAAGSDTKSPYGKNGVGAEFDLAPYYSQNDTTSAGLVAEKPLERYDSIRLYVDRDLDQAIEIFDAIGFYRTSKLFFDGNLARAIQAYNCLQMAWAFSNPEIYYRKGLKLAQEVINSGEYQILPYENLLTTGFVDVNNSSWMWGLDVTPENRTGLASFFGQMDIHTYSYAYAGAIKGCDQLLYQEIPTNDHRREWFDTARKYIADWKFYDLNRGETADEIDRDWLNDIVFMRIEEMYLVAAECACNLNDLVEAKSELSAILSERLIDGNVDGYCNWNDQAAVRRALYHNWRIEMFAEGRGLITFKRFFQYGGDFTIKKRGSNHFAYSGQDMHGDDFTMLYIMPSSEAVYNNQIGD